MASRDKNKKIKRYDAPAPDTGLPEKVARFLEPISEHIDKHWGASETVFHELISEYTHIDLHIIKATSDRPYHTLITSGMSDRPMTVPKGAEEYSLTELVISLPPEWPMDVESWKQEEHWWPMRWLKRLARFPHEYKSWLFYGHTVPNGDPAEPFADNTELCGMILSGPTLCHEGGECLEIDDTTKIFFPTLIPIYREEMEFALNNPSEQLLERLEEAGITELLDITRPNVCL